MLKAQNAELPVALFVRLAFTLVFVFLSACSSAHLLVKTPNIYSPSAPYPAAAIPVSEQGATSEIFYVTDRQSISTEENTLAYGSERSAAMVMGSAHLQFGKDLTWENLVNISQSRESRDKVVVTVAALEPIAQFPPTPLIFTVTPEGPVVDADEKAAYMENTARLRKAVQDRMSEAGTKDIVFYVHGFNNSFNDAVLGLNDVWHFSGRHGVPIAYSWPSGSGNLFGYFGDRESGEYTIYHLKETLRMLSAMQEVDKIHIIAHSRGTDITTTALRELVIEARAAGHDPKTVLKIENLIMAAPDLDYGVVTQRLIAEKFGPAFGKITIYMNKKDSALGISQFLMQGIRFGRLQEDQQNPREDQIFANVKNVTFVNVEDVSGFVGHSYFREHPGALSDIITLITKNSAPGSPERPLKPNRNNFWSLDKTYLSTRPETEAEAEARLTN